MRLQDLLLSYETARATGRFRFLSKTAGQACLSARINALTRSGAGGRPIENGSMTMDLKTTSPSALLFFHSPSVQTPTYSGTGCTALSYIRDC
jgi:hypothetical protein